MAKSLVPDELWKLVEPLLPSKPSKPKGGRPRVPDRQALSGILFVLKTGIPWEDLPKEMNCGSGMTCWRRLRDWQEQGVWECIHLACLEGLQAAEGIDWRRAVLDSAAVGAQDGPQPYRPGKGRQQASCHNRCSGNPAGHTVNWC
jgi:transposase